MMCVQTSREKNSQKLFVFNGKRFGDLVRTRDRRVEKEIDGEREKAEKANIECISKKNVNKPHHNNNNKE